MSRRALLVKDVIVRKLMCEYPFFSIGNCYYYKRICIDTTPRQEDIFDTSTDLWRPLNLHELEMIINEGLEKTNKYLVIKNARIELEENRRDFHIATIKRNEKDKTKYFKKAIEAVNKLRSMIGY